MDGYESHFMFNRGIIVKYITPKWVMFDDPKKKKKELRIKKLKRILK